MSEMEGVNGGNQADESEQYRKARCLLAMTKERANSFQKRREKNRHKAHRFRVSIAALGALTTVLLGLQVRAEAVVYVKNAALLVSAAVTVLAAWESFADNRGLWIRYTSARGQMLNIQEQVEYMLAGDTASLQTSVIDELFEKYQLVLVETNNSWLQGRTAKQSIGTSTHQ